MTYWIPLAFPVLAVAAVGFVAMAGRFRDVRWPLLAFLCAWTITSGLAGAYFMTPQGLTALGRFIGSPAPPVADVVTTSSYITLLFAPLVLVPIGALIGARIADRLFSLPSFAPMFRRVTLSQAWVLGLSFAAVGYCLWALFANGSLVPDALLDTSASYEDRMRARAALMSELGFAFYAVFYAVIPALAALCTAMAISERAVASAWTLGLAVNYLSFWFLSAATYLKAPFVYMLIILGGVIWASGLSISKRLVASAYLGAVTAASVFSMQVLLGGIALPQPQSSAGEAIRTQEHPAARGEAALGESDQRLHAHGHPDVSPSDEYQVDLLDRYWSAASHVAEAVLFRMGAAFPFYVSTFSDPAERCGIELPIRPALCIPPTKVFRKMYPSVDFVTGYAPAAAHVSAFGEAGMVFSIVIMIAMGLAIGSLAAVAARFSGALGWTFTAIAVIFAYFLSQVPLIGAALIYGHAVVFFLLPVAVAVIGSEIIRRITRSGYRRTLDKAGSSHP